jgi:hypothetical protein
MHGNQTSYYFLIDIMSFISFYSQAFLKKPKNINLYSKKFAVCFEFFGPIKTTTIVFS